MSTTRTTGPGDTRQRLLDAAVTAFAERGFHGTSTRDIAAAAGMSPAAVYVHHKSKEELLYALALAGHDLTLAVVREAIASAATPREQLTATARAFALHHARGHTSARVVNYELAALSPEHHAEIRELRRAIAAEIRGVIQRGMDDGDFSTPDAHMTATTLLSLGIDVARWWDDDGAWTPEALADFHALLALRIVGAA
jgi:AcrR family transcriptional regulator